MEGLVIIRIAMGAKSKNTYSVRATVQGQHRDRQVGGPWRATLDEAILSFIEMLRKKGQADRVLKYPMVARRATIEDQIGHTLPTDASGVTYRRDLILQAGISSLLIAQGMNLPESQ
jgi:hypothetical protein